MPNLRLTKSAVEAVPYPVNGQVLYRDTILPGFGLRVGARSKVFFAEGQVNRHTKRVTIGRADVFAPDVARKKALALLGDMAEGVNPNEVKRKAVVEQITLAKAFEDFFEARSHLAPLTVQNYTRTAKLYLKSWRKKPINEITRQMVLKKHQDISAQNGKTTANNVMRHFRSVFNFVAATQDDFPPNPAQILTQARAWHREQRRQTVVSAQDLPMWWKAVLAEPDYSRDFLLMALFTGMRRGELMKLRWENVNLETRLLYLPKTKNGDPLMLPMSNFLTDLLKERHARATSLDWVFPGPGKDGHLVETKKFLLRVSAGSGVAFTLHDLRRTFITIAESLDVPYYALKRLLNHRANSDVTGGYIVVDAERLRDPVQRVAEKILKMVENKNV